MNKQYSNKVLALFRILSIIASIILVLCIINDFFYLEKGNIEIITNIIGNIVVVCLLTFVSIFPIKFGLLSVPVFYYAILIFIWQPGNSMGVLMYLLGVLLLELRGLLKKNRKLKITGLAICYVAMTLSEIRFGWKFYSDYFTTILGYTFITLLIIFFSYLLFQKYKPRPEDKILNLAKYDKLNKDDLSLLTLVQKGLRYKKIADSVYRSEGTVRNRLNKVFKIIESGDRTGFLSSYGDWKIVWQEEATLPETQPQSYSSPQKSEES